MAPHHVAPGRHVAPARTPDFELRLVDDYVLPHAALVNHSTTSTLPLARDHILLISVMFPDVPSPMFDVDIVNVQPLGAISPLALDHLHGRMGT